MSGRDSLVGRRSRHRDDVSFPRHDGGFGVAEILDQVVQVAVLAEVLDAGHILWLALRRVREWEECACGCGLGGHV